MSIPSAASQFKKNIRSPRLPKIAEDLNALYKRFHTYRDPKAAGYQEELIRDARRYAATFLNEARSPEAREKTTRHILNEWIPKHVRREWREAFRLGFVELHNAIWYEGYPSLAEKAELEETTEQRIERREKKLNKLMSDAGIESVFELSDKRQRPGAPAYNTVKKYLSGKVTTQTTQVRRKLADALKVDLSVIPE